MSAKAMAGSQTSNI